MRDRFRHYLWLAGVAMLASLFITLIARAATGGHLSMHVGAQVPARNAMPDLATSAITVSPAAARPGERVTYTLSITNSGFVSAAIRLTDTLPQGIMYVTGTLTHTFPTSSTVSLDAASGVLSASTPQFPDTPGESNLPVSQTITVTFAAQVQTTGTLSNAIQLEDQHAAYAIAPVTLTVLSQQTWLPVVLGAATTPISVPVTQADQLVVCDAEFGPDLLNGTPTHGTARSDAVTPPMAMVASIYLDTYVNRYCLKRVVLVFDLDEAQTRGLSSQPVLVLTRHPGYATDPARVTIQRGTYTGDPSSFTPELWTGWETQPAGDIVAGESDEWRVPLNWIPTVGRSTLILKLADESPGERRSLGALSAWLEKP